MLLWDHVSLSPGIPHFVFGHIELGGADPEKRGPRPRKQHRGGGAFSFLHKHISQFIEGSWASCVHQETIPKTGFWQAQPSELLGPFTWLCKCQWIQHSSESLKSKISSWRNRHQKKKKLQDSTGFSLNLAQCSADGSCLTNFCCCWMKNK